MKKVLFLAAGLLLTLGMSAKNVYYEVDNEQLIANPERGFYHYSDVHLRGKGGNGLSDNSSEISACKRDGVTLLFRYFYIDYYNDGTPITEADLQTIASDFAVARRNGVKVIVRFSYGASGYKDDNNWSFVEPTKEGMLAHMKQLKPVLAENADVIAAVQAGFVGIWGEWFFTSTFGKDWSKPNAVNDRNDLIDGLLDMAPADRFLQLRTVHYITEYMGKGSRDYTTQLTDETAFSGSNQARLGLHNDAFCNDRSNCGTYYDYNNERNYLANMGQYAPLGGETNGGSVSYYKGEKAMADMELLHFDYMNCEYESGVLKNWKDNKPEGSTMSYYEIMQRRMGYRFQLIDFAVPDSLDAHLEMPVVFNVHNDGFSNMYNKRVVYLVMKGQDATYMLPMKTDPRLWKSGTTKWISETFTLPEGIADGTYHLYMYLPDVYESIAANEAYAVRFANKNMMWENGMNDLNATVLIKAGATYEQGWSGLQNVSAPTACTKFIKNQQVYVCKDEHVYSTSGQQIN